jgi:nucleotide-binding universal stress UspA family protein
MEATMRTQPAWITRILFATDFSPCAHHAEKQAAFLSKAYGAKVDVVHVLELYPGVYAAVQDHEETDGRLADAVQRLRSPTVSVTGHQRTGIPSVQICEVAMEYRADLIVMGTHGRTGLDHILLGSTAERVLTMAPCPVLTIRAPKDSEARQDQTPVTFKQIVVPIDFSDCSLDALEHGIQLAKDFGAALTLLHVLEPALYDDDGTLRQAGKQGRLDERIDPQLTPYVNAIQAAGVPVRAAVRGGIPADSILEFVRASGSDLIVMGTHGRRGIAHVMRGSVAEAILRRSACPVLVVKDLSCAPGHKRVLRP